MILLTFSKLAIVEAVGMVCFTEGGQHDRGIFNFFPLKFTHERFP